MNVPCPACSRCRKLVIEPDDRRTVRVGEFPPRTVCLECAATVAAFAVTAPELESRLALDLTPG